MQLDLAATFLPTAAATRRGHPDESRAAAATVHVTAHQVAVLAFYETRRTLPAIADEDAFAEFSALRATAPDVWPHISPSGFRSRRAELARVGMLVPGAPVRTATGRVARTWRRP